MRLTSISVRNFHGIRAADLQLTSPVNLFCGANGAGKSSLFDAVRHALLGESARVPLKKQWGEIINTGGDGAYATVAWDGGSASIVLPKGTRSCDDTAPALPFVIDAQRFSSLPDNERRAFLFGLMKLSAGGDAIKARLLARQCDAAKVGVIMPTLRAGFDAGHKEAQAKARDAKAAWREITGETYGEKKAATWAADVPAYDAANLAVIRADIAALDAAIEEKAKQVGEMQGAAKRIAESAGKLDQLRERAASRQRIQDKLALDTASLAEWQTKVDETRAKATGIKPGFEPLVCPHCAGLVDYNPTPKLHLTEYRKPDGLADKDAIIALPEHEKARALMASAVANGTRDLAAAVAAEEAIAGITKELTDELPAALIEEARADLEAHKAERAALQGLESGLKDAERQAEAAAQKTINAALRHAEVAAWDVIADALAPDGIPGEMLGEALAPINARLEQSSNDSGWAKAAIAPDMAITAGGRNYCHLSESEKYRADAMISEAVSHLSGVKLLCLDGADVLDLQGRADLLGWLDLLANEGEIDSALIFATLKALPSNLPTLISAHWIANGIVGDMQAAA